MTKKIILLLGIFLISASFANLSAKEALAPNVEKKFLKFGWDTPTPEYLDKNLEMIAMESGFASGNYLGTIFKKSLHMTPLHYRREFQDGISRLPSVAALSGTAAEALDE